MSVNPPVSLRFGTVAAVDPAARTAWVRFPGGADPHPVSCVEGVPAVGAKVSVLATPERMYYTGGGAFVGLKTYGKVITWASAGNGGYRHNLAQEFGITTVNSISVTRWAADDGVIAAVFDGNVNNFGITLRRHDGSLVNDATIMLGTIVVGS